MVFTPLNLYDRLQWQIDKIIQDCLTVLQGPELQVSNPHELECK